MFTKRKEEGAAERAAAPTGNSEVCEVCGARYTPTPDGRCPNNNCPRH
jgi:hypothetical protein